MMTAGCIALSTIVALSLSEGSRADVVMRMRFFAALRMT